MKNIVVLVGGASGSGLALIRAIKKQTVCKAYVLCTNKRTSEIIASSKYVNEVHVISSSDEESTYVGKIKEWYLTKLFKEKPILYFTFDTACYYIDNNRQWFEDNFTLCLASSEIIQTYTEKGLAEEAASEAGLSVPKTQIINTSDDINKVISFFSFPVIIKPRATYLIGEINFKIKVFDNKKEFKAVTKKLLSNGNSLLCQEFIPGGDEASYYYLFYRSKSGVVYENMGQKTLQSSPKGGIMAKGMTKYNESLSQISRGFLKKIDYKGIGGIEFKKHNGEYYFIEMSVRLEGFYKIAEISNSPLSLFSYYDLTENKKRLEALYEENPRQKDGFIYIDFMVVLATLLKAKAYIRLVKDIFSLIFNGKVKLNIYAKNDSIPFWKTIKNVVFK